MKYEAFLETQGITGEAARVEAQDLINPYLDPTQPSIKGLP
jgi:hypothetical protein